jgi:hypothetical protein
VFSADDCSLISNFLRQLAESLTCGTSERNLELVARSIIVSADLRFTTRDLDCI